MSVLLQNQTVLVVGRGSGFARAVALAARDAGADTDAVMFALTSSFLTGQTLHIDGGEPLT